MYRISLAAVTTAAFCAFGSAAAAQEGRFYIHAGPAVVDLDEAATFTAGGQPVPGGDISIDPQTTAAVEFGYFVRPNIAVSLTVGIPPKAEVEAAGTLQGTGRLGELTYGPAALTAHYHFNEGGRFRPYVGAGVAYLYVFDAKDGVVSNLEMDNTFGLALQVGADYALNERFGVFADYKKAFLDSEARGNLGPAPLRGDIQVDPAVWHAGISYRF